MPTQTSNLTAFSNQARAGSNITGWGTPSNAQVSDNTRTQPAVVIDVGYTDYLQGLELVDKPPAGSTITEIRLRIERLKTGLATVTDSDVMLVKGGVIQTSVDKATGTNYPGTDAVATYTFTAADLATLGIGSAEVRAVDFGAVLSSDCVATSSLPAVDQMFMEIDYTPADDARLLLLGVGS